MPEPVLVTTDQAVEPVEEVDQFKGSAVEVSKLSSEVRTGVMEVPNTPTASQAAITDGTNAGLILFAASIKPV